MAQDSTENPGLSSIDTLARSQAIPRFSQEPPEPEKTTFLGIEKSTWKAIGLGVLTLGVSVLVYKGISGKKAAPVDTAVVGTPVVDDAAVVESAGDSPTETVLASPRPPKSSGKFKRFLGITAITTFPFLAVYFGGPPKKQNMQQPVAPKGGVERVVEGLKSKAANASEKAVAHAKNKAEEAVASLQTVTDNTRIIDRKKSKPGNRVYAPVGVEQLKKATNTLERLWERLRVASNTAQLQTAQGIGGGTGGVRYDGQFDGEIKSIRANVSAAITEMMEQAKWDGPRNKMIGFLQETNAGSTSLQKRQAIAMIAEHITNNPEKMADVFAKMEQAEPKFSGERFMTSLKAAMELSLNLNAMQEESYKIENLSPVIAGPLFAEIPLQQEMAVTDSAAMDSTAENDSTALGQDDKEELKYPERPTLDGLKKGDALTALNAYRAALAPFSEKAWKEHEKQNKETTEFALSNIWNPITNILTIRKSLSDLGATAEKEKAAKRIDADIKWAQKQINLLTTPRRRDRSSGSWTSWWGSPTYDHRGPTVSPKVKNPLELPDDWEFKEPSISLSALMRDSSLRTIDHNFAMTPEEFVGSVIHFSRYLGASDMVAYTTMTKIRSESGGGLGAYNFTVRNKKGSSAVGLLQNTKKHWLKYARAALKADRGRNSIFSQYHGYISNGSSNDAGLLSLLTHDPMLQLYVNVYSTQQEMQQAKKDLDSYNLGPLEPAHGLLYHVRGPAGGKKFLWHLKNDPNRFAESLVAPDVARKNPTVFAGTVEGSWRNYFQENVKIDRDSPLGRAVQAAIAGLDLGDSDISLEKQTAMHLANRTMYDDMVGADAETLEKQIEEIKAQQKALKKRGVSLDEWRQDELNQLQKELEELQSQQTSDDQYRDLIPATETIRAALDKHSLDGGDDALVKRVKDTLRQSFADIEEQGGQIDPDLATDGKNLKAIIGDLKEELDKERDSGEEVEYHHLMPEDELIENALETHNLSSDSTMVERVKNILQEEFDLIENSGDKVSAHKMFGENSLVKHAIEAIKIEERNKRKKSDRKNEKNDGQAANDGDDTQWRGFVKNNTPPPQNVVSGIS